jgi:hypothetical protein
MRVHATFATVRSTVCPVERLLFVSSTTRAAVHGESNAFPRGALIGPLAQYPSRHLYGALERMKLVLENPSAGESYLTWYQATRHTFASQYMMASCDARGIS